MSHPDLPEQPAGEPDTPADLVPETPHGGDEDRISPEPEQPGEHDAAGSSGQQEPGASESLAVEGAISEDRPAAEAIEKTTERRLCLECATPLDGPYCATCGQRDVDRLVPLGELVGDLLDELAGLQTRLGRTLKALLFRPGLLTREYVEGRRVRSIPPARLYLILALGFFLLVTAFDPLDAESSAETIASAEFAARVAESGMSREDFTKLYLKKQNSSLPTILLVVMIPMLAGALKLFYAGSRVSFVRQLVFAFHFSSVVLIALAPGAAFAWLGEASTILYLVGFLAYGVWLLLALRHVYGQSWLVTSFKAAGIYFTFIIILSLCFLLADRWALDTV